MAHSTLARRRLIVVGGLAVALAACDRGTPAAPSFKAVDITGADYARDFDLPDVDGRQRTLADFKGRVTVVFFGFTQCPDVCPTTLSELAAVKNSLGADGDRVQGVFITVDPERDTPELLRAYVANFGAGFVALRGTPEQTQAAAKHFKVFYAKVPGSTPGNYSIDHTAASYVFDAQGRVRLFARYGSGAEALQHDLKLLLGKGSGPGGAA
ncbi:MAG: SCO family protein [Rubrivivax sp.]|nr:SCO family protein [Rubrivivax sp.]